MKLKKHGYDIRLVCQLANSPDLNILDLRFFNSIQSIQYKTTLRTLEELVDVVDKAFQDYEVGNENLIFFNPPSMYERSYEDLGSNRYDTPHIRKGMLERQGRLPVTLGYEASLVQEVMAQINE